MGISKEYSVLFNGISSTITEMETMLMRLKELQQTAEEVYLSSMKTPEVACMQAGA